MVIYLNKIPFVWSTPCGAPFFLFHAELPLSDHPSLETGNSRDSRSTPARVDHHLLGLTTYKTPSGLDTTRDPPYAFLTYCHMVCASYGSGKGTLSFLIEYLYIFWCPSASSNLKRYPSNTLHKNTFFHFAVPYLTQDIIWCSHFLHLHLPTWRDNTLHMDFFHFAVPYFTQDISLFDVYIFLHLQRCSLYMSYITCLIF